jgi:hypothetical protein
VRRVILERVVPLVRISELLANPLANAEAHLDDERVRSYIENADQPAVVVFETDEGLLLVDGYHRVAAARARGEVTVDAETRSGSRRDALRYAATNGASQRGISVDDALLRIQQRSAPVDSAAHPQRSVQSVTERVDEVGHDRGSEQASQPVCAVSELQVGEDGERETTDRVEVGGCISVGEPTHKARRERDE